MWAIEGITLQPDMFVAKRRRLRKSSASSRLALVEFAAEIRYLGQLWLTIFKLVMLQFTHFLFGIPSFAHR